jgi:hypothetical protein
MFKGTLQLETALGGLYQNTSNNDVIIQTGTTDSRVHISPLVVDPTTETSAMAIGAQNIEIHRDIIFTGQRLIPLNEYDSIEVASVVLSSCNVYADVIDANNFHTRGRFISCNWEIDTSTLQNFRINRRDPYKNGLTITYGGNVGVQTEFPSEALHINGNIIGNSNATIHGNLYLDKSFIIGSQEWVISGSSNVDYYSSNLSVHGNALLLHNLGIGEVDPTGRLHFSSNLELKKIVLQESHDPVTHSNQFTGMGTGIDDAGFTLLRYHVTNETYAHTFYAGSNDNATVELFRIQGNGLLGILNSNPEYTLDVTGDIRSHTLTSSHVLTSIMECDELTCTDTLRIRNDLLVDDTITGCNNITIAGESAFLSSVYVASNIQAEGDLYLRNNRYIYGHEENPTYSNITIYDTSTMSNIVTYGHVGIGSINPDSNYMLDVQGAVHIADALITDGDVTLCNNLECLGNGLLRGILDVNQKVTLWDDLQVMGNIYTLTNRLVQGGDTYVIDNLFVNNDSVMSNNIRALANVSIGLNAASNAPLQFTNDIQSNKTIVLHEAAINAHEFCGLGTTIEGLTYQVESPSHAHIFSGAADENSSMEIMRMFGDGRVGVGVTQPEHQVDIGVDASVRSNMSIGTTLNNYGAILHVASDGYKNEDFFMQPDAGKAGSLSNVTLAISSVGDVGRNMGMLWSSKYGGGVIQSIAENGNALPIFLNPNGGCVTIGCVNPMPSDRLCIHSTSQENEGVNGWIAYDIVPQYIDYIYASRKLIQSYSITPFQDNIMQTPITWIIQASLDGNEWTIIDQQEGITWESPSDIKHFMINNVNVSYTHYRIYIYEIGNNSLHPAIGQWTLSTSRPIVVDSLNRLGIGVANPHHEVEVYNGSIVLDHEANGLFKRPKYGIYLDYNKNFGLEKEVTGSSTNLAFIADANFGSFQFKQMPSTYDENDQGNVLMTIDRHGHIGVGAGVTSPMTTLDVRGSVHVRDTLYKTRHLQLAEVYFNDFGEGSDASNGIYKIFNTNGGSILKNYMANYDSKGYFYLPSLGVIFSFILANEEPDAIYVTIRELEMGTMFHEFVPLAVYVSIELFFMNLVITPTGMIGINKVEPQLHLDLIGNAHISSNIFVGQALGIGIGAGYANLIPTAQLQLGNHQSQKQFVLYDTASNASEFAGMGYSNGTLYFTIPGVNDAFKFVHATSSTTRQDMLVMDAVSNSVTLPGRLGVGTSNPSQAASLHASGNVHISTPSFSNLYVMIQSSNCVPYSLRTNNSNGIILGIHPHGSNQGNNLPSFYVQNKTQTHGRFGFNTLLPESLLHVQSDETRGMTIQYTGLNAVGDTRLMMNQVFDTNTVQFKNAIISEQNAAYTWTQADLLLNPEPSSGNVCIGSTHAFGYRMFVNGSVYAATGYHQGSDIRIKHDLKRIDNALARLEQVNGYTFRYNDAPNTVTTGCVAQEVELILPEAVHTRESDGIKSIAYGNMMGMVIEAIKELRTEVQLLKEKVDRCGL